VLSLVLPTTHVRPRTEWLGNCQLLAMLQLLQWE
jgi:hypothetical protein